MDARTWAASRDLLAAEALSFDKSQLMDRGVHDAYSMTDNIPSLKSHRMVYVQRPSPALVREIGGRLSETVDNVRQRDLVAAIQRVTGCSRATAYRAVRDWLAQLETSH